MSQTNHHHVHMATQLTNLGNNHYNNPKLRQEHQEQKLSQHHYHQKQNVSTQNNRVCHPPSPMKVSKATKTTTTQNSSHSWSSYLFIITSKLNVRILLQLIIVTHCLLSSLNLMINTYDDSHCDEFGNGPCRNMEIKQQPQNYLSSSTSTIGYDIISPNSIDYSTKRILAVSSSSAFYDTIYKTIEKHNNSSNNQGMDIMDSNSSSIDNSKMIQTSFCISKDNDNEVEEEQNKYLFTIDNYCSRPHYNYDPMIHTETQKELTTKVPDHTNDIQRERSKTKITYKNDKRPILIIGGIDGSGTRAFADLLKNELGVPMVIDDEQTLDINANILFYEQGWPALANYIFNFTHSGNYNINTDIPKYAKDIIMEELQWFKKHYDDKANSESYMNYVRKMNTTHSFERSSYAPPLESAVGISYGFKAPISMMLLPFFLEVYDNVKFIHVVRDGRDVSFGSNMSPVTKFYDQFYGIDSAKQRRMKASNVTESVQQGKNGVLNAKIRDPISSVLSMDLWNDWNMQVNQFCQKASAASIKMMMTDDDEQHDKTLLSKQKKSFDYITVRAEDLVSPSVTTKYALITKLASFVGTIQYPNKNLCSYVKNVKVQDMGQSKQFVDCNDLMNHIPSDQNINKQSNVLQHRYGKWMNILQNETTLSEILHERGAVALKHFGYEPYQNNIDYDFYHSSASRICP